MNSVSNLMREYFEPQPRRMMLNEGLPKEVPIKAKQVKWKVTQDGMALMRTYEFPTFSRLRLFINDLLAMQERVDHHAQILIEENTVKVRVGTKVVGKVTEMDTEYAAEADHIYDESSGEESGRI